MVIRPAVGMIPRPFDLVEARAAERLGVWSAFAAAGLTVAFLVALAATPLLGPIVTEWRGAASYAATFAPWTMLAIVPSLLLVVPFVALLAAIHHLAPPHRRWAATLALGFGAPYAAIVGLNDYVQLTTVRASLIAGDVAGLDPLVWVNPNSVFGSLEGLGYFFQTLSVVALIPVFWTGRYGRWIAYLFLADLVLSLAFVVVQFAGAYVLLFPGLVVWSLLFAPAMVLIGLRISHLDQ